MGSDEELLGKLRQVLIKDTPPGPRPSDIARIRALAAARGTAKSSPRSKPALTTRSRVTALNFRRMLPVLAAVASLIVGVAIGLQVQSPNIRDAATQTTEFRQTITTVDGGRVVVEGREAGIGRIVDLSSTDLPILTKGAFYEVWFVGPGDSPQTQNRISAGTFHPDAEGKTKVSLTAAVDPRRYRILVITAEPGDGNPDPSAREILRGTLEIIR